LLRASGPIHADNFGGRAGVEVMAGVGPKLTAPVWRDDADFDRQQRMRPAACFKSKASHRRSDRYERPTNQYRNDQKWVAIAGDRLNHALVVYERGDGMSVVDVFEVLNVFENEDGIKSLRASSLATKFNVPDDFDSTSMSTFGTKPEHDVEIPLSSIVESHRYAYGTGL
jgi:hypothetical protein